MTDIPATPGAQPQPGETPGATSAPPGPPPPSGGTMPPPQSSQGYGGSTGAAGFTTRYGLVRPRNGRYLAGVCAAIGRATNTDPVLWRVLFAVLAVFFAIGVLVYVALWLIIPAEGDSASPIESVLGKGRSSMSPVTAIVLGVGVVVLFGFIVTDAFRAVLLGAAILIGGALLLSRNQQGQHGQQAAAGGWSGPGDERWTWSSVSPWAGTAPWRASSEPAQAPGAPGPGGAPGPSGPVSGPGGYSGGYPGTGGVAPGAGTTVPAQSVPTEPGVAVPPAAAPPHPSSGVPSPGAAPPPTYPGSAYPGSSYPGSAYSPSTYPEQVMPQSGYPQPTYPPPAYPVPGPQPPGPAYRPPFAPHGPYGGPPPPPAPPAKPPKPPKPPKERSALGAATFSLVFVAMGLVAMLDLINAFRVRPSTYFAAALVTIALGLLVGTWLGKARWLIGLGLVAAAALGISTLAEHEVDRGPRNEIIRPSTVAEVSDSYDFSFGDATLDLSDVDFSAGPPRIVNVRLTAGSLDVILPETTDVTARVDVDAGDARVFDRRLSGFGQPPIEVINVGDDGVGGGTLTLNVHVNTGEVVVSR